MITGTLDKNLLVAEIDEAVSQLQSLMASLEENKINTVPYEDSWTPGQLFRHVAKSINGMAQAMRKDAKPAERDPAERIPELKKVFLNFSIKMKSPDFIVPEEGLYEKGAAITELNSAAGQLKTSANNASLNDMLEGLPLGPITKLELLHFILYHTQRHLHQMKKIVEALKNK